MANSIETTGTDPGPVETEHEPGQSVRDWVAEHGRALDRVTPDGDTLETTWVCIHGEKKTTTTRQDGESDANFMSRHKLEFLLDMLDCEPIP
jgi:hypothetical protein